MLRSAWSWGAITAWGATLLAFALAASAIHGTGVALRGVGVVLCAVGAAAAFWGAMTLHSGGIVFPRLGVAGALVGIAGLAAALLLDPDRTGVLPVGVGALFFAVLGMLCATEVRRRRGRSPRRSRGHGVLGTVAGAVLVAALAVPALAATEAGQLATPHDHSTIVDEHRH